MISELNTQLQKIIQYLRQDFAGLHVGRANAAMVDDISVEMYGTHMPLKSMANIACPDSRTIRIEPWDKSVVGNVEKAIKDSDLGMNPQNMGNYILISVPPMTEERRRQTVKKVYEGAENSKISIRNIRHEILKKIKQQKDNKEISEDQVSKLEKQIQESVDMHNKQVDELAKSKEKDVLSQ
ncbi:ribosome recycling factor [Candidatus Gracilibacteria bacterium]|nr:ribosome recycling factor [Candidatus Gracilibacteria bacterium]